MITLLSRIFIKNDLSPDKQRSMYGILCGVVGIILNIFLFAGKFFAGVISKSISITADAFNNLSDAGSSVVSLLGFKLAEQKADSKHPYGHGRMEYISGFVVSVIIIVMGFELLKDSIAKIIHPEETEFSLVIAGILVASILVKCYMAYYNFSVGKKIDSASVKATATDSLSDCIATATVLVTSIITHFTGVKLDGYSGVVVAGFVLFAGVSAAKETMDPLLGNPPEEEYIEKIEKIVTEFNENILGMHDLMVHDYGPGRQIISLHAEVPADGDILVLHDIIDNLEYKLSYELGCVATIHLDPIAVNDPVVNELRKKVVEVITGIDSRFTIHDFRIVEGNTHTNLIFDIVVPYDYPLSDEELTIKINMEIQKKVGKQYFSAIKVDKANIIH